jgi:hypothetical protein
LIEVPESQAIRFYMKLDDTDIGHRLEVHCENSLLSLFGYKALFECPYNSVISIELLISTYERRATSNGKQRRHCRLV